MVGSSNANLFASISAGICALWGPLHGGANEACVNMLQKIVADGGNVQKYVDMAKDKSSNFRLMGFGHRVYKNYDPRAKIIKRACDKLLAKLQLDDPLFEVAQKLEEVALKDPYFVERKLYPNVDFYSGIIYRAMGLPCRCLRCYLRSDDCRAGLHTGSRCINRRQEDRPPTPDLYRADQTRAHSDGSTRLSAFGCGSGECFAGCRAASRATQLYAAFSGHPQIGAAFSTLLSHNTPT